MRCLLIDRLGRQQTRKGRKHVASAAPAPGFCHLFGDIVRKSQASARVDKRSASVALTCERTPISVRESKSTPSRQKRDRSPNVTGSARRTSISFVTDATRNCRVEFNCPEPAHWLLSEARCTRLRQAALLPLWLHTLGEGEETCPCWQGREQVECTVHVFTLHVPRPARETFWSRFTCRLQLVKTSSLPSVGSGEAVKPSRLEV